MITLLCLLEIYDVLHVLFLKTIKIYLKRSKHYLEITEYRKKLEIIR